MQKCDILRENKFVDNWYIVHSIFLRQFKKSIPEDNDSVLESQPLAERRDFSLNGNKTLLKKPNVYNRDDVQIMETGSGLLLSSTRILKKLHMRSFFTMNIMVDYL